ncbi:hypothetical protein PanWU01x14_215160 [Parasponia andersonii]|uniref:Uncharacterized protein n=1 Tax=Parasponia andersonii TaxID=3476 RepID=A0A2P5BRZ7_PARAD|nr:hypothetical protein PanWU01x14_215160 [Parasponia andersonii]
MGSEIEVVLVRKFGDEQSSLLDKFERLSFEIQLNRAMLGRSLSEPGAMARPKILPQPLQLATFMASDQTPPALTSRVRQGRRRSGFQKVLKKLLKPIIGFRRSNNNNNGVKKQVLDPKDPRFWNTFSRSLRF